MRILLFTKTLVFTLFVSFLLLGNSVVFAQIPTELTDIVQADIVPSIPGSNTQVTVTIKSFSIDLNLAVITWYVNGKIVAKDTGLLTFTTKTGKPGSITTITAIAKTPNGQSVEKTITLQPADIDLIWETDGYVPPFYEGKSLFVMQNTVTFTAIPNFINSKGQRLDPKTLIYKWSKDYTVLGDQGGYAKQSLVLQGGPVDKPFTINVEVTDPGSSLHGSRSIILDSVDPELDFYQNDPLYGILYNSALPAHYNLTQNEVKLITVPYYFSNSKSLSYTWNINNYDQPNLKDTPSVTLRGQAGAEGTTLISLRVDNLTNIFQSTLASLAVTFNKVADTSTNQF